MQEKKPVRKKRRPLFVALQVTALLSIVCFLVAAFLRPWIPKDWRLLHRLGIPHLTLWLRPEGMAPAAHKAFLRACRETGVSPARVGQTIGDHPLSVGYHKRDGVLLVNGKRIEYCAAVDLGANDMDRPTLNRFLSNLTRQGFACWYREKGHWTNREHIHAIYAQLPMKHQLRRQVKLFLRERRAKGIKPLPWEQKLRRTRYAVTYPKR
jgi:hypothetical protein